MNAVLLLALGAWAQSTVDGDAWVLGKLGVGSASPGARLEVVAGPAGPALQVSGVDETPFLRVDPDGRLGLGTTPAAGLDINGTGDAGDAGLELRSGDAWPAESLYQLTLSSGGSSSYRHAVRSVHLSSTARNALEFLLWEPGAGSSSALPVLEALSLTASTAGASVHVRPVGDAWAELTVSNGASTGGGTVHRFAEGTHSSRRLKEDIRYLGQEEQARAYQEVRGLRHARFRYRKLTKKGYEDDRRQPEHVGLIYEEAPASVRAPGYGVSVNARVLNAELALKELIRRLERAQGAAGGAGP